MKLAALTILISFFPVLGIAETIGSDDMLQIRKVERLDESRPLSERLYMERIPGEMSVQLDDEKYQKILEEHKAQIEKAPPVKQVDPIKALARKQTPLERGDIFIATMRELKFCEVPKNEAIPNTALVVFKTEVTNSKVIALNGKDYNLKRDRDKRLNRANVRAAFVTCKTTGK